MIDPAASGDPMVARTVEQITEELARRQVGGGTVALSRGTSPQLREAVGRVATTIEAPAVRGRAVWAAVDADLIAVEQPNWWGRVETEPPRCVVLDRRLDVADWAGRVKAVRRTARTITQLPRVRLAYGDVEAPWFVALLPVPAEEVTAAMTNAGMTGATAVDRRHAELPGGIRLSPPPTGQADWTAECVACIAAVAGEGSGGP